MNMLAQLLALVSCVVIVWRAEPALNRMSRCTPFVVRIAFWLLVVASSAAIGGILLGEVPPWPAVVGSCGAAALMICERRLRYLTQHSRRVRHDDARSAR